MKRSDMTKQRILAAAEQAFSEKGLYGARIDEIAESAEANKRMIYAYFGDKEQLYLSVLDTVYARMAEEEQELLQQPMGCEEAVRKIIQHYFRFLRENPTFVRMVLWENLNRAEYFRRSNARQMKGIAVTLLREKLLLGMQEGIFPVSLDVEETIFSINMFCFSYFSNNYTMAQILSLDVNDPATFQKHCDHVTNMIMTYLMRGERHPLEIGG